MSLQNLFLTVLVANMIGFGGLSTLPVVRSGLVGAGLPADALLLQSLAVGNISPGPNGLYLVALGYFVAGVAGALAAVLALLLPPMLVLVLEHARARLLHRRRFRAALASLSISVVALLALSSGTLALHAATTTVGAVMLMVGAIILLSGLPSLLGVAAAIGVGLVLV